MKQNWKAAFSFVIKSEGGYVNDPVDHGGETNLGVTRAAWGEYLGRPVRDGEMRSLTVDAVEPFYKRRYWYAVRGDDLPSGVDYAVFDFAVNAGVSRAARTLQRAVNVQEDGNIGPTTLAAVKFANPKKLVVEYNDLRKNFYSMLVAKNDNQRKFLNGWFNRVAAVQRNSDTLAA